MGCGNSKLDDPPPVALCRDRCNFLEEALSQSYALADAHVAYMQSLRTLGPALHRFFTLITEHSDSDQPEPPKYSPPPHHAHSSSNSDHNTNPRIEFHPTEAEDTEKEVDYFNQRHDYYLNHNQTLAPSPPPPSNSAWDFLNFFDAYERYEPQFDHKEEIPDFEHEPVEKKTEEHEKSHSAANVSDENNDISEKDRPDTHAGTRVVSEAMREIHALFDKASDSGNEVSKLFEIRVFRYEKVAVNQAVSFKVLNAITPSLPRRSMEKFSPLMKKIGPDHDAVGLTSGNISSTLEKLCMWEKKLYNEVKAEEKLLTTHEKKCKQLKRMNERGAEAYKVDSTQSLISDLSTKMKISIQVVDRISITINEMRDEELREQINKLILGLRGMWEGMLDCHRCQSQAVGEGKILDGITSTEKFGYPELEAGMQLKFQLQNCKLSFFNWIDAQRAHCKALNGWLLRCLLHEPEETHDGLVPFSPGKIGAPPVFVICNRWSQVMDRISEKEVIESMQRVLTSLNQLLEPLLVELQQRSVADKDMESKLKILDREELKIQKLVQAQEKKMGNNIIVLRRSEMANTSSLLSGLKQTFGAMERFTADCVEAYEELCQRIQEDRCM